jgi:hypothetical protein
MIDINRASFNDAADWWRHEVGVNVIPADTKKKMPKVPWKPFEKEPVSNEQHEQWKAQGMFNEGLAIIVGKVSHNDRKKSLYLIAIDLDNKLAIEEYCTRNGATESIEKLSGALLIEQHSDDELEPMFIFTPRSHTRNLVVL